MCYNRVTMSKSDKFAIIKLGGKQHLVKENDVLEVNKLTDEPKGNLDIEEVLLINEGETVSIGTPFVKNAKVTIELIENTKGDKVYASKFKSKSRYRRKVGHRQQLTKVKVNKISIK